MKKKPTMVIPIGGVNWDDGMNERAQVVGHGCVEHWSGHKTRDPVKAIPGKTTAVGMILDRVNHTLARKMRAEANKPGLPAFF